MTGGANFPGIETANSKKDAVKKAFNQEYQATMKAMANAADRARQQILDQKLAAASHGQSNQPSQNGNPTAQSTTPSTGPGPTSPKMQEAPSGSETASSDPTVLVMIEIANELRRIIVNEIDIRMNHLASQVEQAIAHSLPQSSGSQAAANTQPATGTTDTTTTSITNTATQAPAAAAAPAPPPATAPAPTTASESTTNATATPNTETAPTSANSPAQALKKNTTSDKNPPNSGG